MHSDIPKPALTKSPAALSGIAKHARVISLVCIVQIWWDNQEGLIAIKRVLVARQSAPLFDKAKVC